MKTELNFQDKALVFASYILFFPSLYLIMTEKRKKEEIGFHSAQALLLWIAIFLIVIFVRKLTFTILAFVSIPYFYMINEMLFAALWVYCLYCALLFAMGKEVKIPLISKISDRIS